jgi:prepilin-type processing-associated H-X9-DG protein
VYEEYFEVPAYNCPSYPDKEQTMDYCINAWNTRSGNLTGDELHGASKLDDLPRHTTTIYLADYEYNPDASHVKIVRKGDDDAALRDKLRWIDIWHKNHLPSAGSSRRMALDRHVKWTNCLFVDGHSEKMDAEEITLWHLGLPAIAPSN